MGREQSRAVGILDCVAVRGSAWDVSRAETAQALQARACIALAVSVGREQSRAVGDKGGSSKTRVTRFVWGARDACCILRGSDNPA